MRISYLLGIELYFILSAGIFYADKFQIRIIPNCILCKFSIKTFMCSLYFEKLHFYSGKVTIWDLPGGVKFWEYINRNTDILNKISIQLSTASIFGLYTCWWAKNLFCHGKAIFLFYLFWKCQNQPCKSDLYKLFINNMKDDFVEISEPIHKTFFSPLTKIK